MNEVMGWTGPMTHRQYKAWVAWLDMEWDRPSRDNWYAMRIAYEVAKVLAPVEVATAMRVGDYKLRFESTQTSAIPNTSTNPVSNSSTPVRSQPMTPSTNTTTQGSPLTEKDVEAMYAEPCPHPKGWIRLPPFPQDVVRDDEEYARRSQSIWLASAGIKLGIDGKPIPRS